MSNIVPFPPTVHNVAPRGASDAVTLRMLASDVLLIADAIEFAARSGHQASSRADLLDAQAYAAKLRSIVGAARRRSAS